MGENIDFLNFVGIYVKYAIIYLVGSLYIVDVVICDFFFYS